MILLYIRFRILIRFWLSDDQFESLLTAVLKLLILNLLFSILCWILTTAVENITFCVNTHFASYSTQKFIFSY
jgi:hypothetical protein